MKSILSILFLVFVASVFAQGSDTYYKDDQGNLYKLTPMTTAPTPAQTPATVASPQVVVPPPTYYSAAEDSTAYYQNKINDQRANGSRMHTIGQTFFWVGIPVAAVGLVMYVAGLSNCDTEDDYNDDDYYYDDDYDDDSESCSSEDAAMALSGFIIANVGGASIVTGAVLKIVGSSKLRKATQNEQKLQLYKARHGIASIKLIPNYDVADRRASLNLALGF